MELGWWKGSRGGNPLVGAAVAVVVTLLACRPNPVRVGLILPLSGSMASYGMSLERGARLAEKHVNATGGIDGRRLKLVAADSGAFPAGPAGAASALERLVASDQIVAAVGGASPEECEGLAPVAARSGVVLISPSAPLRSREGQGDQLLHNWPSIASEGEALADFAAYTLHASKALVFAAAGAGAQEFAEAFAARFRSPGRDCEVLSAEGESSGSPPAGLVAALGRCQVAVFAGLGAGTTGAIAVVKALPKGPVLLARGAIASSTTLKSAEADGVLFARPAFDEGRDSGVLEFAALYAADYGEEGDVFAAHAYDAVIMLAETIARTGSEADALRNGLLRIRDFPGAAGAVSFDAAGRAIQPFHICIVEGGRAVSVQSVAGQALTSLQARVEARRFGK